MRPSLFVLVLFSLAGACVRPHSAKVLRRVGMAPGMAPVPAPADSAVTVTYLGSGGVSVRFGTDVLLVDPFFSHQGMGRIGRSVFLGDRPTFRSSPEMVRLGLRAAVRDGDRVAAILNTHSHYDHLMDIPLVYANMPRKPALLLGKSAYNIVHATVNAADVVILEEFASSQAAAGAPVRVAGANGTFAIWPVLADHNPHFKHVKFFDGHHRAPVGELDSPTAKSRANLWLEGNTFSFVIDHEDISGQVDFRIFIQSSSCHPPAGIPPAAILGRRADLAILGVVSYHFSPGYPCELLGAIRPAEILWVHWEDFFRPYHRRPRTIRGTDVPGFFRLPCVAGYSIPGIVLNPRTSFRIAY